MELKYMLVLTACIGLLGVTVEVRSQQQCSPIDPSTGASVQGTCFANCPAGTQFIFDLSSSCASTGTICCIKSSGTGGTGGGGIGVINPTGLTCGIAQANINVDLGNGVPGLMFDGSGVVNFVSRNDVSARSARILGGTTVSSTASRHCWIAQILSTTSNGQSFNLRGAGAIVNANYIITSASAVLGLAANQLRVRVGATSTVITAGSTTELLLVSNVVTFTGYRRVLPIGYPVGDVALLRLSTAIDFTTNTAICGACLPNATSTNAAAAQDLFLGERCHVAGYGVTAAGATTSDNLLREVMVPVLPTATCSLLYRLRLNQQSYNTDLTAICAGGQQGKDTCSRDGGAPL
ncbi:hypothetical protein RvY_00877-2 [Ramazzottius varieornatus]|uniref:Peptidase S1 domain-containing protein n=1 Tax=Ramazzottius varieornatus TaxID=947166 RepID=A0A1D1UEB2_RAMVA|nr:hypothetical protein RvY_00877-2 [Ramazzottius varieornatus]